MQDYEFKIQVPGRASTDAPVTVGKANLDMSKFCGDQNETRNHLLPITVKVGSTTYPKVYVELIVTSIFLADANEDSLTEVSGMTGLTSHQGSVKEQDLEGALSDPGRQIHLSSHLRPECLHWLAMDACWIVDRLPLDTDPRQKLT